VIEEGEGKNEELTSLSRKGGKEMEKARQSTLFSGNWEENQLISLSSGEREKKSEEEILPKPNGGKEKGQQPTYRSMKGVCPSNWIIFKKKIEMLH